MTTRGDSGRMRWVGDGCVVGACYSLSWGFVDGIVEDYDLNPDDHPKMMDVMQQSVGEAIIDTILQVLDDNAHDPGQNERLQVRAGHEPHLTVREARGQRARPQRPSRRCRQGTSCQSRRSGPAP
jgi:hypothetical protein